MIEGYPAVQTKGSFWTNVLGSLDDCDLGWRLDVL